MKKNKSPLAPDLSGARVAVCLQECYYLFPSISSRNGDRLAALPI
jgi:hypothetical protein